MVYSSFTAPLTVITLLAASVPNNAESAKTVAAAKEAFTVY